MANLTSQIKKAVKAKIDPIFEELQEQYEAARFHRQLMAYRNRSFENSKPVKNDSKLLQMQ